MSSTRPTDKDFLQFDVMQRDRFVCTMRMPVCKLFQLTITGVMEYVYSKRPTLRYEKGITIYIDDYEV